MDMNKIYNMDCLEGMKKLPNILLYSLNAWRMTTFYLGQIKVMLF